MELEVGVIYGCLTRPFSLAKEYKNSFRFSCGHAWIATTVIMTLISCTGLQTQRTTDLASEP